MFKYFFVFTVFIISYSCSVSANIENTRIEKEVLASFESLVEASRKLNSDLYLQHFDSEKFVGLNSDGTNWNSIDELTPIITAGFNALERVTFLEFSNVNVSVIDSHTAVLVNEYAQTLVLIDGSVINASGGGTQVWSKRSGKWKIVSVSASNKPNASTP